MLHFEVKFNPPIVGFHLTAGCEDRPTSQHLFGKEVTIDSAPCGMINPSVVGLFAELGNLIVNFSSPIEVTSSQIQVSLFGQFKNINQQMILGQRKGSRGTSLVNTSSEIVQQCPILTSIVKELHFK
ncbi:hypothetical protein CSKR_103959 [Clonorchis sinensis]|uniref:Uncharacterized protein n=1 Tax=Clonorchis sinensis TaxID=79923 RepID=A0A3R7GQL8_CLOSI|nr:hypothetical protein CSKR_103959 [Clonorchis sinensis]